MSRRSSTSNCTNHRYSSNLDFISAISSLSSIDINRYTINLVRCGKLLRSKSDHNHEFRQIFTNHGASICCCVIPNTRTIPYYNFESTHFIYFQYKRHILKHYTTQKRFSYYLLHITHRELYSLDKFIKQNNTYSKFFAEPYTKESKPLSDTIRKRGNALHAQYLYEEWLITKPTPPSGPNKSVFGFGKKKSMTSNDVQQYAKYIHKILNTPSLLLIDRVYQLLNIRDTEIITLFKILALNKLQSLKSQALGYDHPRCLRDPTKLQKKIGITFHTLWIVKRPLNDKNAAFLGCDHWALKFEGNDELMTIGWFSFKKEHGLILTKIVPNNRMHRRLFWYYWPRDKMTEIKPEYFNVRWTVLEKLYLREIPCDLIGNLIVKWLSYGNTVYDLTNNNCQHFVRDFVAPLNIEIAKRLSSSFDVKIVKALMPGGVLAERIDSEAKCNNLHKRLWRVLDEYKDEEYNKKEMDVEQLIKNNFDLIANEMGLSFSSSSDANDMEIKEEKQLEIDIEDTDSLNVYKKNIDRENRIECDDDDMVLTVSNSFPSVDVDRD